MIQKLIGWLGPQRLLALAFRLRRDSEFVVSRERRLTRRHVLARVHALAAGLQTLGVQKGDRVATLLPASPEAVYTLFLPWVLGNWEVPLNPLLREHELRHILADCQANVVITTRRWYGCDYPALLARLLSDLPHLRAVVVQGADAGDDRTFFSLEEIMARGKALRRACPEQSRRVKVSPKEIGRITYTSGTTGLPKGATHTWERYWGLAHPAAVPRLNPWVFRCVLFPFPLCYYHGALAVITTLLAGGKIVLTDRFSPREMLEIIEREKVSLVSGAPTMYRLLLRTPGQERCDLSSVRRVFFGTEVCPPDLACALHERFGCPLENAYATNETGNITWTGLNDPWAIAATTVGKPVPGARVRIVDDARQPLPAGAIGEIAAQTAQMMLGYYDDPQLTAQVLDAAGWFYTGDLGYLGEDGNLRLTGRKKDVIIRGGQKVYPEEVEQYLEQHPAVRRAGVVGVPSGVEGSRAAAELGGAGETVWAFLELNPGATLTESEILDFCRGQIAPFKIPERVRFVERLPTAVTGKVQRFRLREMCVDVMRET